MTQEGSKNINPAENVDYRRVGIVPLEPFLHSKEELFQTFGLDIANKQPRKPPPNGITHEALYWIDDIYMITTTGVKQGWLDKKKYGPTARKAWIGLAKHVNVEGNVTDVCIGTDKGFTLEDYMDRGRATGDLHRQTATLWSAMALLR